MKSSQTSRESAADFFPCRVPSSRKCVVTSPLIWMGNAEGCWAKSALLDLDISFILGWLNAVEILLCHPVAFCLPFTWGAMIYDTCSNTKETTNHVDDTSINGQNTPPILQQTRCNNFWMEPRTGWVEQRMSNIQKFVCTCSRSKCKQDHSKNLKGVWSHDHITNRLKI